MARAYVSCVRRHVCLCIVVSVRPCLRVRVHDCLTCLRANVNVCGGCVCVCTGLLCAAVRLCIHAHFVHMRMRAHVRMYARVCA